MGATVLAIRRIVRIPAGHVQLEGAFESQGRGRGVVVFAHGSGSSRMSPRNRFVAIELRRAGFATLLTDLLTEDEDTEAAPRFDIDLLTRRLHAAVRWAQSEPDAAALPVALFGAGTGAAAALRVAAGLGPGIAAVVSRGGRPDLTGEEALGHVTAPTLLIVGARDPRAIELNEAAYEALPGEKSISIVPSAGEHFEEPGALERVAALASEWLLRHVPTESSLARRDATM
jgi:putative phosphoribosyl transferase